MLKLEYYNEFNKRIAEARSELDITNKINLWYDSQ